MGGETGIFRGREERLAGDSDTDILCGVLGAGLRRGDVSRRAVLIICSRNIGAAEFDAKQAALVVVLGPGLPRNKQKSGGQEAVTIFLDSLFCAFVGPVRSTVREPSGAPGRNRTCDPRLRRPMLYPTELRAPWGKNGGEGGIRTPGRDEPSAVFKTAAIDHSATSPQSWTRGILGEKMAVSRRRRKKKPENTASAAARPAELAPAAPCLAIMRALAEIAQSVEQLIRNQ